MIYEKAQKILAIGNICDRCLGRQFARILPRIPCEEKGRIIKKFFALEAGKSYGNDKCWLCNGLFLNDLKKIRSAIKKKLKPYEFKTFLVGVRLSDEIVIREESLWEKVGNEFAVDIKYDIRQELEKFITENFNAKLNKENPDVNVIYDIGKYDVTVHSRPLFIKGEYKKFARGLAQTRSEKYRQTVQSIIAKPVVKVTRGSEDVLHTVGREEKNARCLVWRPFVLEIKNPKKRYFDLKKIAREINKSGKVRVRKLAPTTKDFIVDLKAKKYYKKFRVVVEFENPVRDVRRVEKLVGLIRQQTPLRVLGVRPERVRHKKVKSIKWKRINNKRYQFEITCESGLYLQEIITGDSGRTKPSVSELLGSKAKIVEIDLTDLIFEGESYGKSDERIQKRNEEKTVKKSKGKIQHFKIHEKV
ncbi:MAG: tRNA pseudouridine(54/55) synthase Pus10 [Candidatus Aenigmarchaeota archaeon]|nr:tRNA pseudouridine(54/55) synthase Pus10 [Candidatus Aenigmarchaeota archaeon]